MAAHAALVVQDFSKAPFVLQFFRPYLNPQVSIVFAGHEIFVWTPLSSLVLILQLKESLIIGVYAFNIDGFEVAWVDLGSCCRFGISVRK